MRKLILSMMTTLDGFVARPDGDLSWFLSDEEFEAEMLGLLRSVDAMLFGRVSYELLAQYWPTAGTGSAGDAPGGFSSRERAAEFAHLMNTIPKIVFSRTLREVGWGPARLVKENVAEELATSKAKPGKDLVLFAGANLASSLVTLDLVDEYRLMIHPVVLGRGLRLFQDVPERALSLVEARTFASGVVLVRHERRRGD